MQITTVLFDLDGTLLPMDQDVFLEAYFGALAQKLAPHGYDPKLLINAVWAGTAAMVSNDGHASNEEVFWHTFETVIGKDARKDEPLFREFYENEFQNIRAVCGFDVRAAQIVARLRKKGKRLVLATNPLFPAVATQSRLRWAGLDPADFAFYTVYENSCHCKPNPQYFRDILEKLGTSAEECLMVGNDASEDLVAGTLGMKIFLLTECLINKESIDICAYPHGSFEDLLAFIETI